MHKIQVNHKDFELFLSHETISKRIRLMGIQLNVDYEGRCPIFIGVLNGSFLFMADLMKEVNLACEIDFIRVASYQGTESSGQIKELFGLTQNLNDRDVIVVEDIVDSGFTLSHILAQIKTQNPASVSVCSLLFKPSALKFPIAELAYKGFEIQNEFVVGYGLDYDGLGRNLKDIYRAI